MSKTNTSLRRRRTVHEIATAGMPNKDMMEAINDLVEVMKKAQSEADCTEYTALSTQQQMAWAIIKHFRKQHE